VEIYLTSPCLCDSRLLPIAKPTGGILPIAIGEVLYRLAALCALAARPDAGKSLSPLQLGVGIRGGRKVAGHALQAGIAADPGCITVQTDWQNAFNTLRRDRMLAAVEERCQALLPMVAWAYKQPSRLRVHQVPGVVIHSQSGVRQGEHIGSLLFALTLQGPLEQVAAMNLARPLAYADNNFLQGAPEPTTQAFQALLTLAGPLGFHPKADECAVYSVDARATASVASQLGVRHGPDGLLAPGRHPNVPGRPCRPLRRTCLPLDGGPDSPTPGRSRPLAPPTLQPSARSGPFAPGLPVDACQSLQRAESQALDCAFAI
jgi:hypothetical protein